MSKTAYLIMAYVVIAVAQFALLPAAVYDALKIWIKANRDLIRHAHEIANQ